MKFQIPSMHHSEVNRRTDRQTDKPKAICPSNFFKVGGIKNRKMSFNDRKLAKDEQMDRRFMFMKIFWAQGVVCPCPGSIYMYMTKIFKHHLL